MISDSRKYLVGLVGPDVLEEADSTALMLDHMLAGVNVKRTRLARGIPMGSDLEFVDEVTMLRAFEGRVSL